MEPINSVCVVFSIRAASRKATIFLNKALKPLKMTITEFSIICAINDNKTYNLTELANDLAMDRTTLTRNADILIKHGWAASNDKKKDRRTSVLFLTASGKDILLKAIPIWKKANIELGNNIEKELNTSKFLNLMAFIRNL